MTRRLGRWAALSAAGLAAIACVSRPGGPHEQALAEAIEKKDVAAARSAIASGVDFDTDVATAGERPQPLLVLLVDRIGLHVGPADPRLEEIAAAVFAAGADPNYRVRRHAAPAQGRRSVQSGGPVCLAELAVAARSPALIDVLLKAGLRVKEECAGRALLQACRMGDTAVVQRLVAAGADVNYRRTSYGRTETPLSAAVEEGHVEVVDILDRVGAQEW
jgi:hypothetical protein